MTFIRARKILWSALASTALSTTAATAFAADAIMVVPEPAGYVRVCDAYGEGYFYIPGTETCLGLSGYVRSTYNHVEREIKDGHDVTSDAGVTAGTKLNESNWGYRGRVNIQAKSETEYGTLASNLRLQGTRSNGTDDANEAIDTALISLAGFRAGYADHYWKTNHGGAAGSPAIHDGYYGDEQALLFDYTYSYEGFEITVGTQQEFEANNTLDFYVGANWKTDYMRLAFTAARDGGKDDWAYKASAIIPLADKWQIGGWYAWEDEGTGRFIDGNLNQTSAGASVFDTQWGVQVNGKVLDNVKLYGLYSETSGKDQNASATVNDDTFTTWTVGMNWAPVAKLNVIAEYSNEQRKADLGANSVYNDEADYVSLRVVRSW